jgi:CDP-glucose 4,6-dehydratase
MEEIPSLEGVAMNDKASNFWTGRTVFVTGATGIVGSWLVKELVARSAEVVALVLDSDPQTELYRSGTINKVHVVNGRLEDFTTVERAIVTYSTDTVLHLGAQAIVDAARVSPLATLETNVRGTWNLLEACRLHRDIVQRVVVASSDKAYGDHEVLPYTEDMALHPKYPYEVSKGCADLIARSYHQAYGLPIGVARCGNIYGGGDLNWSRIVPGTIRSLHFGNLPVLRSDGNYIRDYIYVKDVVEAYLDLAEHLDSDGVRGETFNFSSESRVTVFDIVRSICRVMGCDEIQPIVLNNAKGEIRNQYLSAAKAARVLKWKTAYSLESGLSETIDWYRAFFNSNRQLGAVAGHALAARTS